MQSADALDVSLCRRSIQTQIEIREHDSGSHSELLVNTLDRPGLLTGVEGLKEGNASCG